jgi:hypothetical protein
MLGCSLFARLHRYYPSAPGIVRHRVTARIGPDVHGPIPARRWLGLTATPYRRDKLDDLIYWQVGQSRHTITAPGKQDPDPGRPDLVLPGLASPGTAARLAPVLHVHPTAYCYSGEADPQAPGGMAAIYRDLVADDDRVGQVTADVAALPSRGA